MTAILSRTSKPEITVERVTPRTAKLWLAESNVRNRKVRTARVKVYARDMASGLWNFTGDPIRFSPDGVLLDGQHRLLAIVESNVTLSMVIVRGVVDEAQKFMDIGAKRTAADALALNDHGGNTVVVANIARGALIYESGINPTHAEIIAYSERYAHELNVASTVAQSCRRELKGGYQTYGVAFFYLSRISTPDAALFFDKLVHGDDLSRTDPVFALRRLIVRGDLRDGREFGAIRHNLGVVFKAWNAWRAGEAMTLLRFGKSESFPEPR